VFNFLLPGARRAAASAKARRRVMHLEAEVEARDRTIRVLQAEIDALAAVVARDRLRVQSETADYARRKAESEAAK